MCGICGIYAKNGIAIDPSAIARMCAVMVHRGPDDEGSYLSGPVGLGIRRLKIIDLETGNQPIHNEDSSVWVVLNGEIYNYLDLRAGLEEKGHRFSTHSDTEVIVHLYEEYAEKALEYLNGMFGLALWDERRQHLLIARDRLGIKQIHYYEDEDQIVFGSEIKTILALDGIDRQIDYQALSDYLSLQYIPAPRSIYRSIKKLPPAFYLCISAEGIRMEPYWKIHYTDRLKGQEAVEAIDLELRRAVGMQLISDVPLGAYLSGGIDSSLLVAMMAQQSNHPVETFSVVWDADTQAFDERSYARFVAQRYGTNHHEFLVKPQIEEVLGAIIRAFDEPFADDSAIPNYYIARETRQHVTVALSGLGGDEMSAGYERYLGMRLLHSYRMLPEHLRTHFISRLVQCLPDSRSGNPWIGRMKRFVRIADQGFGPSYFTISSKIETKDKFRLLSPEAACLTGADYDSAGNFLRHLAECDSASELNQMLYIDMKTYMVDQLLVLSDRMSMAHSLELRVPYLDHLLVEQFASVVPFMKLRGMLKKHLLKKVAERYFPKRFIYRKKMGFSSPIVLWLRGEVQPYMRHVLNRKSILKTGMINPDTVATLIDEHVSLRHNHDTKLWSLMMLMLWYDAYIDGIY